MIMDLDTILPKVVGATGIEPARLATPASKAGASTYSATLPYLINSVSLQGHVADHWWHRTHTARHSVDNVEACLHWIQAYYPSV